MSDKIKSIKRQTDHLTLRKETVLERCRKRILENRNIFLVKNRELPWDSGMILDGILDEECSALENSESESRPGYRKAVNIASMERGNEPSEYALSVEERLEMMIELQEFIFCQFGSTVDETKSEFTKSLRDEHDMQTMLDASVQEMEEIDSLVDFFLSGCSTMDNES